jgi:hypothetical protein
MAQVQGLRLLHHLATDARDKKQQEPSPVD